MREEDIVDMGVKGGSRNLTNLRYADVTTLQADNITASRRIFNSVEHARTSAGLNLNAK